MKVPYGEGVASHTGPESCGSIREDAREALTGVRAGWPLNPEMHSSGTPRLFNVGRRQHRVARHVRAARVPRGRRPHARTQAPRKRRRESPSGSREVPPPTCASAQVRAVNPQGHDGDARRREVGQARSTREILEQRRRAAACGEDGGKGPGQGECLTAKQGVRTQRRLRIALCDPEALSHEPERAAWMSNHRAFVSEARARCGNSARRDPCGGRRATAVPTATINQAKGSPDGSRSRQAAAWEDLATRA